MWTSAKETKRKKTTKYQIGGPKVTFVYNMSACIFLLFFTVFFPNTQNAAASQSTLAKTMT